MIRQKIVCFTTYGIYPATYGGPVRALNLMRAMSAWYDVTALAYDCHAKSPSQRKIGAGLRALTFPTSEGDQRHLLHLMERSGGLFLHDALCAADYRFTSDFINAAREAMRDADIIVVEQPYFMPAVERLRSRYQIVVNSSQNYEFALKGEQYAMGKPAIAGQYLRTTQDVEAASFALSDLDICVSEEDRRRLSDAYRVPAESLHVIPNCTDCSFIRAVDSVERQARKDAFGLRGRDVGIFLGSGYPPNVAALRTMARALRDFRRDFVLLVVGSIADHVAPEELAGLVDCEFLGYVSDAAKAELLGMADVALHIITEGGGTNLKLFDYMAAGLPIITNALGARGVADADSVFAHARNADDLPRVLEQLLGSSRLRDQLGAAARRTAELRYDWPVAARRLHGLLGDSSDLVSA